jgi:PKD repeat protein
MSASSPALVVDSKNHANIVWAGFKPDLSFSTKEIYYKKLSATGFTIIETKRLTYSRWDSDKPQLDVDASDNLHIVWCDERELRTAIYYIKLAPTGKILINDTVLAEVGAPNVIATIAVDTANNVHIVWNNHTVLTEFGWNGALHYLKLSSIDCTPIIDDTVITKSLLNVHAPSIDTDKNNRVNVVWADSRNFTTINNVYYLKLDATGKIIIEDKPLTNATPNAWEPVVGTDTLGNVYTVWSDNREGVPELFYKVLSSTGEILVDTCLVTEPDDYASMAPDIAIDSRNRVHLCWVDNRDGNLEIYYKHTIVAYEGIDLQISPEDILFSPAAPLVGDQITCIANIYNIGTEDMSEPIGVEFYEGDPETGGMYIGAAVVKLNAGSSDTVSTEWTPTTPGDITIFVVVDPNNMIMEVDEANNIAWRTIYVAELILIADAGEDQFVEVGTTVYFDGSGSTCSEGEIDEYNWNFGDGAGATGIKVNHTYSTTGKFTVILEVVKDSYTAKDTCIVTVVGGNEPPIADAGQDKIGIAMEPIEFDGSSSYDPDGELIAYSWDFGDGTTASGVRVIHTYRTIGNYEVVLTVTDDDDASASDYCKVTIKNAVPVASAGEDCDAIVGEPVRFDASASYDLDGTIISYTWDFDASNGLQEDGEGVIVTHVYELPGRYTVTLIVVDDYGDLDTDTLNVTVISKLVIEEKKRPERFFIPMGINYSWLLILILITCIIIKVGRYTRKTRRLGSR